MSEQEATPHQDSLRERLAWWVLFDGHRLVVAGTTVVLVFLLTLALVRAGVVTVGPASFVPNAFSSLIAGLFTLVTVTLTINQLILSRVFGTPGELSDQLGGSREFRESLEYLTDRDTMPNQPAEFLSLVGELLYQRTTGLRAENEDADWIRECADELDHVASHADDLREIDSEEMTSTQVLERLLGSRTARSISVVDRIRNRHAADLSAADKREFEAISSLLSGVAVARQYYKTLALQQMLAQLSRYVAYFGAVSILAAFYVTVLYRSGGSPAVDPQYLGVIVSAGVATCAAPMVVLLAYILRVATISRYTLSVGPFFPPEEQIRSQ